MIISIIAALSVFASHYFKNRDEKISFAAAFILFALAWRPTGYWIPSVLNFVFAIFNMIALRKPIVSITRDHIIYPSFPKKTIQWNELSNMLLKEGLLTIDFKNNKLIQQNIAETSIIIDEKEFNDFCHQQLNK